MMTFLELLRGFSFFSVISLSPEFLNFRLICKIEKRDWSTIPLKCPRIVNNKRSNAKWYVNTFLATKPSNDVFGAFERILAFYEEIPFSLALKRFSTLRCLQCQEVVQRERVRLAFWRFWVCKVKSSLFPMYSNFPRLQKRAYESQNPSDLFFGHEKNRL